MDDATKAKQAAGIRAAQWVESGMRVGLGTGSTTAFALMEIGRRCKEEGLEIVGVPTSFASERLSRQLGIPLSSLDVLDRLEIAFDGADEVDPDLRLIKGRGAAHTREKVVASQADRFVVLIDPSKLVDELGSKAPVPVEVLPMAVTPVTRSLEALGGDVTLRIGKSKDGPVVSDQGFWILDVFFGPISDPEKLNRAILEIPGVLDHGMFLGIATDIVVGHAGGATEHIEKIQQKM